MKKPAINVNAVLMTAGGGLVGGAAADVLVNQLLGDQDELVQGLAPLAVGAVLTAMAPPKQKGLFDGIAAGMAGVAGSRLYAYLMEPGDTAGGSGDNSEPAALGYVGPGAMVISGSGSYGPGYAQPAPRRAAANGQMTVG